VRKVSVSLAVIGLIISLALIGWFGFGKVIEAISRVGWAEFGVILGWQIVLFVILGLAWDAIMPSRNNHQPLLLIWGRMVRDCATNCLPFSQVGGFVFGARAVTLHGLTWSTATASTVVDVTAEFLAEIAFTGIGLAILIARAPQSEVVIPLEVGLALAVLAGFFFIWLQQGATPMFARISRRIAGRWFGKAEDRLQVLQAELSQIYGQTRRLLLGFAVHLIGWLGTGVAGFIAYRALGIPIQFDDALAIEALLAAIAALSFLVPLNVGVQEAGYAGLGTIFGIPPEMSLAVSLLRRARDVSIGVPILLIWQFVEVRRLREKAG